MFVRPRTRQRSRETASPNGSLNRSQIAGGFNGFSNLISNGDGGGGLSNGVNSNQVGTSGAPINALLGSLGDNGGPTQTFALLPGSPAIDAGDTDLPTDQRDIARPQRNADDIGAFERPNSAPSAAADAIQRFANRSVSVLESTLLANDTDPEGDNPLTIVSVSNASSGQASVTRANGYVFYDPSAGFNSGDTFTYQVQDSRGAISLGSVTVTIASGDAPANSTLIVREPATGGGTRTRVTFTALAGRTYRVQYTDSLTTPITWTTLPGSVTADAQGQFQLIDPPPLPSQRFCRALYP